MGAASEAPRPQGRVAGYDVARAVAICFMVLENFKVYMLETGAGPHILVWLASLTNGRSAPLFVVLAGVGITLMSTGARARGDRTELRSIRRVLLVRSLFLLAAGNLFIVVWSMDILHFYAWYVGLASLLFLAASRRMLVAGMALVLLVGETAQVFWGERYFEHVDYWTPTGMLRDTFLDGIHPTLPWLAFVLFGMWLGRLDLAAPAARRKALLVAIAVAALAESLALAATRLAVGLDFPFPLEGSPHLLTTRMCPPGPFYMVSAAATSAAAIALCHEVAARRPTSKVVAALVSAGQLSLTLYIGHAIVGAGLLWVLGALEGHGPLFLLGYWAVYYVLSVVFAVWYRRRFGRGPFEWLMRRISGSPSRPTPGKLAESFAQLPGAHRAGTGALGAPLLAWVATVAAATAVLVAGLTGVEPPSLGCETGHPLAVGDETTGELTALCSRRRHELVLTEPRHISLSVRSGMDSYLEVWLADESEMIVDDDDSGPARTPLLEADLPAGNYVVVVHPYRASTGPYVLSARGGTREETFRR